MASILVRLLYHPTKGGESNHAKEMIEHVATSLFQDADCTISACFFLLSVLVAVSIRCRRAMLAFVEYTQPEACELAIASMNRKSLLDRAIHVKWARAPKRGEAAVQRRGEEKRGSGMGPSVPKPMAPPGGMSKAPLPKSLATIKPPAHVVDTAAAHRRRVGGSAGVSVPRLPSNVPRPGGGPSQAVGAAAHQTYWGSFEAMLYDYALI